MKSADLNNRKSTGKLDMNEKTEITEQLLTVAAAADASYSDELTRALL